MKIFAFDLETVPDLELAKNICGCNSNEEALLWIENNRNSAKPGQQVFPRMHLHKIVAASCAILDTHAETFDLGSLGYMLMSDESNAKPSEDLIITDLQYLINQHADSTLVTWNGSGFDIPVLLQRSFIHGIDMSALCDQGQIDDRRKYNNFLNRYHSAHIDLCDKLANFGSGRPRLGDMAVACGLGGKLGVGGPNVSEAMMAGKLSEVEDYCEIDSLLTLLLYIRYLKVTGSVGKHRIQLMMSTICDALKDSTNQLVGQFLCDIDLASWI